MLFIQSQKIAEARPRSTQFFGSRVEPISQNNDVSSLKEPLPHLTAILLAERFVRLLFKNATNKRLAIKCFQIVSFCEIGVDMAML